MGGMGFIPEYLMMMNIVLIILLLILPLSNSLWLIYVLLTAANLCPILGLINS